MPHELESLSDRELLERVVHRDDAAYEVLYRRYAPACLAVVARSIRDHDHKYGVVNWALYKFSQAVVGLKFDSQREIWPYLLKIVQRGVVDHLRSEGRFRDHHVSGLDLDPPTSDGDENRHSPQIGSDDTDPLKKILLEEDRELVRRALDRLSPEHRQALVDYYFEDMTFQQMATSRGVVVSTVHKMVHASREAFRLAFIELRGKGGS